jgi:hypothetical protein
MIAFHHHALLFTGTLLLLQSYRAVAQSCQTQQTAYENCFATLQGAYACNGCVNAILATKPAQGCSDFATNICPKISMDYPLGCPCWGCSKAAEELLVCQFFANGSSSGCPFFCGLEEDPETLPPPAPGIYTQEFLARFVRFSFKTDSVCDYGPQTVEISCDLQDSLIEFLRSDFDTVSCTKSTSNIMTCTDTDANQNFGEDSVALGDESPTGFIYYTCSGAQLSGTTVTFEASQETCNIVTDTGDFGTHTRLATVCENKNFGVNDPYGTGDYISECVFTTSGVISAQNYYRDDPVPQLFGCYTHIPLPSASGDNSVSFPAVAITSTKLIGFAQAFTCFTFQTQEATSTPAPMTQEATPGPVLPPTATGQPTVSPVPPTTSAPQMEPSVTTTEDPTSVPVTAPTTTSTPTEAPIRTLATATNEPASDSNKQALSYVYVHLSVLLALASMILF